MYSTGIGSLLLICIYYIYIKNSGIAFQIFNGSRISGTAVVTEP